MDQKPIAYVTPTMAKNAKTIDKHDELLNVFILNDRNEKATNESLSMFVEIYSERQRTDREFWLLDATHLISQKGEPKDILENLKELKLDLDDDLYIFSSDSDGKALKMYEFYEIHPSVPRQMVPYGFWDSSIGLLLTDTEKWNRRKNLQVVLHNYFHSVFHM